MDKIENKSNNRESFEIVKECDTLLNFVYSHFTKYSRTTLKSLLAHKQIAINGRVTTQFNEQLKEGDRVTLFFDKINNSFQHPKLSIIYEDDHIIVVNKMSGLLSMATERDREHTAYKILNGYIKNSDSRKNIFILHRLDRETSGVMIFAKSAKAQEIMQSNWNSMVTERKYVAVVEGYLKKDSGRIESYIAENRDYIVHKTTAEEGKLAITNFKLLKSNRIYSLVELELETGRKNQIRVHMQSIKHPIAGDEKYGAKSNPIRRVALHAQTISFIHPITKRELHFETPVPKKFLLLVKNRENR